MLYYVKQLYPMKLKVYAGITADLCTMDLCNSSNVHSTITHKAQIFFFMRKKMLSFTMLPLYGLVDWLHMNS